MFGSPKNRPRLTLNDTIKNYKAALPGLEKKMRYKIPKDINMKGIKKCDCGSKIGLTCARGINWIKLRFRTLKQIEEGVNKYYRLLKRGRITDKDKRQIDHDLHRTFPEIPFFRKENAGYWMLKNLLRAVTIWDTDTGYVQGMNFIAACFLWHADECYAFWLFVHLMEELEMRDIYQHGNF